MADPMRIRATESNGVTEVKILMRHEMESGQRKDAAGKTIPAWHITSVSIRLKDKEVMRAQFGPSISKDPFLSLKFKGGAKGEKLVVNWVDTKGDARSDEAVIG
ncbi:MAG: thiosulfate oxidation carrier complex protein SoxZ [Candidatus Protistobacter heckmanni]|nr:thiosulfate oxidation carrier complex protein SoxZ [Candidatus Protistobacter heckmanni]